MICRYFKTGAKLDVAGLNEITVLIDRSETERSEVALNSWWPGLDGPPHKHEQKEQLFFVTSGEGNVRIGEDLFSANCGNLFYVPANVIHQTINRGKVPLEYLLFNAFLSPDKEGHASFAEHVNHMKSIRKLQADTQSPDDGSGRPVVASNAKGKQICGTPPKIANGSLLVSQGLLGRAETQGCEAMLVSWSPDKSCALTADQDCEQVLFFLEGTGSISIGLEKKSVKRGDVIFVPRGVECAGQAGSEGLNCLSLRAVVG